MHGASSSRVNVGFGVSIRVGRGVGFGVGVSVGRGVGFGVGVGFSFCVSA